ncbi:hypothetical protein C4588_02925 [Candidatus Parcubacteria bacterium]|nr:MAG: hypothetical protein C4588_02925 [Candidatus Parcubacteria bacterium]
MSLFDLFTVLKGSSLSGNFGHAGRPGVFGGSAPGGGHRAIGLDRVEDKKGTLSDYRKNRSGVLGKHTNFFNKQDLWDQYTEDWGGPLQRIGNWLGIGQDGATALIGKAFSYYDEETGYQTTVSDIKYSPYEPGSITIEGTIWDKSGLNSVGYFTRTLHDDKTIHHDLFRVTGDMAAGFGSRFYENAENAYKQGGITQIHLEANLEVGGYAWARMGFDFQTSGDRRYIKNRVAAGWRGRYRTLLDVNKIPSKPYQIALMTGPDGHRIGKDALLGSSWYGYKNLDSKDPGYRVGRAYYRSKKKK